MKFRVLIMAMLATNYIYSQDFVISTSAADLVELKTLIPEIALDIKYACTDNFTGTIVYSSDRCFARKEVAKALVAVQKELKTHGFKLLIWDIFRPVKAQWKFWNICPDPNYVSDPRKGGRHTRGTAVDCTIVASKTGVPIDMGTEFDDFTEKAWRNCTTISEQAQKNRTFLEDIMNKYGFIGLPTEWWHFDYNGWESMPVLDVDIESIP